MTSIALSLLSSNPYILSFLSNKPLMAPEYLFFLYSLKSSFKLQAPKTRGNKNIKREILFSSWSRNGLFLFSIVSHRVILRESRRLTFSSLGNKRCTQKLGQKTVSSFNHCPQVKQRVSEINLGGKN